MSDLRALFVKLEEANHGRREFDFDIMETLIDPKLVGRHIDRDDFGCWWDDSGKIYRPVPHFTAKIDDALSIAHPKGHPLWTWYLHGRYSGVGRDWFEAEITVPSREFQGTGHTPATALCVAALKAREATK